VVGTVGNDDIYTFENDTGPDDANHDQDGVFVLWDPRRDHGGQYVEGLQLMDVAPTVLDLTGARGGGLEPGDRVDADAVRLARRLIDAAPVYLGLTATGFEYRNENGLTAILEAAPEGQTLRATFGDGRDLGYKLAVLFALLQRTQSEGRQVRSVDLRFGERVAFQ
jgi:hypothetical protein